MKLTDVGQVGDKEHQKRLDQEQELERADLENQYASAVLAKKIEHLGDSDASAVANCIQSIELSQSDNLGEIRMD